MKDICGLSANDIEEAFLLAGADMFWIKPFPCKKEELNNIFAQWFATRTNEDEKREELLEDQSESETLEISSSRHWVI